MNGENIEQRLIEADAFQIEFLSQLAERESWRKELHRPVYHVHKWWANRLGSVFRGILLGCALGETTDLESEFYRFHDCSNLSVFDPFMGSGTTIGEAHKLGMTSLGRDINPVAVRAVATALGHIDRDQLREAFQELSNGVGRRIRKLYVSRDAKGRECDALYYFWVMQVDCPLCDEAVDLFRSRIVARNAAPRRKQEVQLLCPGCGDIFPSRKGQALVSCQSCGTAFDPSRGAARGKYAICQKCECKFSIVDEVSKTNRRPDFRLYGKLVLTNRGGKEYLPATDEDHVAYKSCTERLNREMSADRISLPQIELEHGHNTRQAMRYGFHSWRDFFNDRQLLALGWLKQAILELSDAESRRALLTLFSGTLEFCNLFASYKGEGTGAVRHMFSHHILKPERMPIEANVWGTAKSSGSFSGLFQSRLLRALDYREAPTELNGRRGQSRVCSPNFSGRIEPDWPKQADFRPRGIYLSCGDSAASELSPQSVDFVVTDPPFFDNVHYSELADFFYAWQQTSDQTCHATATTTRQLQEVQDTNSIRFAEKLTAVFREVGRTLKKDGLLVFTYHHSRPEGWRSVAQAIFSAGFRVVNTHPVKSEMSVATPKFQTKDPIQLDVIIVCRKHVAASPLTNPDSAVKNAKEKLCRLIRYGFRLSRNDCAVAIIGQLLTASETPADLETFTKTVEREAEVIANQDAPRSQEDRQRLLF